MSAPTAAPRPYEAGGPLMPHRAAEPAARPVCGHAWLDWCDGCHRCTSCARRCACGAAELLDIGTEALS